MPATNTHALNATFAILEHLNQNWETWNNRIEAVINILFRRPPMVRGGIIISVRNLVIHIQYTYFLHIFSTSQWTENGRHRIVLESTKTSCMLSKWAPSKFSTNLTYFLTIPVYFPKLYTSRKGQDNLFK